ncbi:MAG: NUDIX hydrolase, partial [Acidimicrobiia bacterium]
MSEWIDTASDERLDIVSPATGAVLDSSTRAEVHESGQWHQVFHCLVLRPSDKSIILQRRALSKAAFPGLLDLSVTGH